MRIILMDRVIISYCIASGFAYVKTFDKAIRLLFVENRNIQCPFNLTYRLVLRTCRGNDNEPGKSRRNKNTGNKNITSNVLRSVICLPPINTVIHSYYTCLHMLSGFAVYPYDNFWLFPIK